MSRFSIALIQLTVEEMIKQEELSYEILKISVRAITSYNQMSVLRNSI